MADILWSDIVGDMTVDTGGYMGDLLTIARAHVDDAVQNNRLTSSQAGEIYTAMIPAAMQNAINFGMNEQLTEAGIDKAIADAEIAVEQAGIARAEAANTQAKALADIKKVYGFDASIIDDVIVIGSDQFNGKMDYEKDLIREQTETEDLRNKTDGLLENEILKTKSDALVSEQQVEIAKAQASKEYVTMLASLGKEMGYDYDLDVEGDVIRSSITDTEDGKIDAEIRKLEAEADLTEKQFDISKLEESTTRAKALAEIDKVYGFAVTREVDGTLTVGTDDADGRIDAEITKMKADADIAVEQLEIVKLEAATTEAKARAEIAKVYGFAVGTDVDGNITIGADQENGKIDYEKELMREQKETEELKNKTDGLLEQQIKQVVAETTLSEQKVVGRQQTSV